jgi:hypothetical protein
MMAEGPVIIYVDKHWEYKRFLSLANETFLLRNHVLCHALRATAKQNLRSHVNLASQSQVQRVLTRWADSRFRAAARSHDGAQEGDPTNLRTTP